MSEQTEEYKEKVRDLMKILNDSIKPYESDGVLVLDALINYMMMGAMKMGATPRDIISTFTESAIHYTKLYHSSDKKAEDQ